MLNEKVLEKLYTIIFSQKDSIENNDLDQSTAKLTEYWKIEAEQIENKFHRFNLFKKTLLHSTIFLIKINVFK